jgi:hypothetical protein
MQAKPGFAPVPAIKFQYLDLLPVPGLICTATLRQCLRQNFLHQDSFLLTLEFVPRSRLHPVKTCTRTAKTRAIPSSSDRVINSSQNQDPFSAGMRRVTQPPFIAGPL